MREDVEELVKRARAGDPTLYQDGWEVDAQSSFSDREPEVLVSRSLRVSASTYEQVRHIATARGLSPSSLMRQWIEEGVTAAQDGPGQQPDPVSLVDRLQRDVARLARALRRVAPA